MAAGIPEKIRLRFWRASHSAVISLRSEERALPSKGVFWISTAMPEIWSLTRLRLVAVWLKISRLEETAARLVWWM
jgi:hypothetical protein